MLWRSTNCCCTFLRVCPRGLAACIPGGPALVPHEGAGQLRLRNSLTMAFMSAVYAGMHTPRLRLAATTPVRPPVRAPCSHLVCLLPARPVPLPPLRTSPAGGCGGQVALQCGRGEGALSLHPLLRDGCYGHQRWVHAGAQGRGRLSGLVGCCCLFDSGFCPHLLLLYCLRTCMGREGTAQSTMRQNRGVCVHFT